MAKGKCKYKNYKFNTARRWTVNITNSIYQYNNFNELMNDILSDNCKELPHDYWITESGKLYRIRYIQNMEFEISEKIPTKNNAGYLQVSNPYTMKGAIGLHTLVAKNFIDKPRGRGKKEVNHKDRNKLNNSVENLEWVTHKQNMEHYKQNRAL